ncbi:MAG: exodeoxyribonuclease III [Candidatus Magasanikbacteria bacterium]
MLLVSWNVNGIRAVIRKGFVEFLNAKKPDIICLQEIKIDDKSKTELKFSTQGGPASGWDFADYEEYWNSAERPGYSGTAIFVKSKLKLKPIYTTGIGIKKIDEEGRVQTLEFEKFFLVNAYFPNTRHDLSRLDFKIEFDEAVLKHVKKLDKKKPVIITGDYNAAHTEIDLANPKANDGGAGFHPEERKWMTKFLASGFIDTFRHLHPKKIQYSWWTYRFGARSRNVGWRIDYFCVSKKLKNKIIKAEIWDDVEGSDHCPVTITLSS